MVLYIILQGFVSLLSDHRCQPPPKHHRFHWLLLNYQWHAGHIVRCGIPLLSESSSGLRDWSLTALIYRSMSKVIMVFLLCPTTSALMCCVCFRIVRSVDHSWAGAAISGSICICVKCLSSFVITELYAAQVGTNCTSEFQTIAVCWLVSSVPVGVSYMFMHIKEWHEYMDYIAREVNPFSVKIIIV